jgi:hypothetical protein
LQKKNLPQLFESASPRKAEFADGNRLDIFVDLTPSIEAEPLADRTGYALRNARIALPAAGLVRRR